MDIVTQGLLGSVAAQAGARPAQARVAALAGFVSALLADADILIRSSDDPLLVLEYHRHFTHALVFIPLGALLATLLLAPWLAKRLGWLQLYGYALLGYATAGVLDACTSYGTHLLWPFSDTPVAWSIIAIIDPVFSSILLVTLALGWHYRRRRLAVAGLMLAASYLLLGLVQHQRAHEAASQLALSRGIAAERILVKPTLGNVLLWRTIAVSGDAAYVDAIRVGLDGTRKIYPGTTARLIQPRDLATLAGNSAAEKDLLRFYRFADSLLVAHPSHPDYIGDLRYAMLPNSIAPLWGLNIRPQPPESGIEWVTDRTFTPAMRGTFIDMLLGN